MRIASESLNNSDWLAGFADGEGCFMVGWLKSEGHTSYSIQFVLGQRADDANVLKDLQAT